MVERFFNTSGPIKTGMHYHIPLLDRVDWDEIRMLINSERYFVLHAPRQTGKTSTLLSARERLIRSRATHLDQLADKLKEERVRNVISAVLSGEDPDARALKTVSDDDQQYVEDIGPITTWTCQSC